MTAKNKKTRKPRPAPNRSKTTANPEQEPGPLARQEMAENDMENRFFRLTRRQQAVLPIVALAPSITQAASDSGVSQRTLYRWLNDPDFRQALTRFHQESANLARQQIQSQTLLAASVFSDLMRNADPALRLRAARYSTSFAARIRESEQIASDVRDIKEALELKKANPPPTPLS